MILHQIEALVKVSVVFPPPASPPHPAFFGANGLSPRLHEPARLSMCNKLPKHRPRTIFSLSVQRTYQIAGGFLSVLLPSARCGAVLDATCLCFQPLNPPKFHRRNTNHTDYYASLFIRLSSPRCMVCFGIVQAGVKDVVLAVNYRPEVMVALLSKCEEQYGIKITFSVESEPLGTGV